MSNQPAASNVIQNLRRGEALAWASLKPVFQSAITLAEEAEYRAREASVSTKTNIRPAYPPLVLKLAAAGAQNRRTP
jgi:hypothetical protein